METDIKDTEKTNFSSFSDIHIEIVDRILELESRMKVHEQDLAQFYTKLQSMDRRIGQGGKR